MNIKLKRLEYYDSYGGTNPTCVQVMWDSNWWHDVLTLSLKALRSYLADEFKAKHNKELDVDSWTNHEPGKSVPRQRNGFDCGVFMCMFADYTSRDRPFHFNQGDMPFCRKRMILDIMRKRKST
jgi:Ulp1 family protease